jgi:hypothetical protein
MRWLAPWVALAASAAAAGCSNAPFCGEFVDLTGRPAVYCPGPRDEPVCDFPDQTARFEVGTRGWELVGGARATCSSEGEVVCPTGTTGQAYCITDPEL